MRGRLLAGALAGVLCVAAPAGAQAHQEWAPRFEVAVGGGLWGGYPLDARRAVLTGPEVPTGAPVRLFDADTSIDRGGAAEVRLGWRLTRALWIEATGGLGVQRLRASVSGDVEEAPPVELTSSLLQLTVEGGLAYELRGASAAGGRLVPLVTGGGGYLRQVFEDRLRVETGGTAYLGAGVRLAPTRRPSGLLGRLGARSDVRVVLRRGGIDVEPPRLRTYVAFTGGLIVRF